MFKLIKGDSTKYFEENKIDEVSLIMTSPSYFTQESKKNLIDGEIGYGADKEIYVKLISDVLISVSKSLKQNGKIVLILGRYNDLSVESIIYMIEDKLIDYGITLSNYSLYGKGNHESIVIFTKGEKQTISIPTFFKLQIYDKVGFFGRINPEILEWAIKNFTSENELVVDPFAGAGSTVKIADRLNRNGLGIEINEDFIL